MRSTLSCLLLLGATGASGQGRPGGEPARNPRAEAEASRSTGSKGPDLVIIGVTVVDPSTSEPARAGQVIVISDGRIVRVGDTSEVKFARPGLLVNAQGKYAVPGFWDMHVEQALPLAEQPVDSNPSYYWPLFIAHGVTSVRDVAGDPATLLRWRRWIASGERVGPQIVFTGRKLGRDRPGTPTYSAATRAELVAAVDSLREAGASDVFVRSLSRSLYGTLGELSRTGGPAFGGLVPAGVTLSQVVAAGQRSITHMDGLLVASARNESWLRWALGVSERRPFWARVLWKLGFWRGVLDRDRLIADQFSEDRARKVVSLLATGRIYQIPTLRLLANLHRAADSALLMPPMPLGLRVPRDAWQGYPSRPVSEPHPLARLHALHRRLIRDMSLAGVPLLAGSDAPNLWSVPGRGLHDELELLVASGLSPTQALRAATTTAAEFLGGGGRGTAADSSGTIAAGKVADIVLLDGDPARDITNTRRIHAVIARGRLHDREALDEMVLMAGSAAQPVADWWSRRAP
ncbi:MAG: amidohydrolase family protein [Gemmatimonadota bacterium]